jgi:MYXO-CTERM domain-containing protein
MRRVFAGCALVAMLVFGSTSLAVSQEREAQEQQDNEDDNGEIGLLGLVGLAGLAGLAGLKRRDRRHDDYRASRPETTPR